MESIIIRRPSDFHAHIREKEMLVKVLPFSNIYDWVMAVGNTSSGIISCRDVIHYKDEIMAQKPKFKAIFSVMLAKRTLPSTLAGAYLAGARVLKLIPEGVSTNSSEGIKMEEIKKYYLQLKTWADFPDTVFSIHLEIDKDPETGCLIPEPERETAALPFAEQIINDAQKEFLSLKIIFEHATTEKLIALVESAPANVAATLTLHHSFLTTGDVLNKKGGIKNPYHYCKPIAKSKKDRMAVIKAATSGNPKFFFGSDSAPHLPEKKKGKNPAAGIFTPGEVALPLLGELFESFGELDKLEGFVSNFGPAFYDLPLSEKRIVIKRQKWTVPKDYNGIVPFMAGRELEWKVEQ